MHGNRCFATPDALLALMQGLGAHLTGFADVDDAIQACLSEVAKDWVPKVMVAWDGEPDHVTIRIPLTALPTHAIGPRLQYTLHLDSGDIWSGNVAVEQSRTLRQIRCGREVCAVKAFLPRRTLPRGYHNLVVLVGHRAFRSLIIAAPTSSFQPPEGRRELGVFAPIYALKSERNWGVGDFADAEALVAWIAEHDGSIFGTLPFLATYLDHPCDPSPYTPVSRLFWNELFVDVTRLPELSDCCDAQELVGSDQFQSALRTAREARLVDYAGVMRLKQSVLLMLSRHVRENRGGRLDAVRSYVERTRDLAEYSKFRAVTTRRNAVWTEWRAPASDLEFDREEEFYHQYCQFVANEQVEGLTKRCAIEGAKLYLDYPLGVHAEGFDTWRYQPLFARGATVGAPPDPVFTTGQNWGFHPVLPDAQRNDGYSYFIDSLRHQMRNGGMLRIDHVMGLHRMYWIPKGFHKSEGTYVHYPGAEIYAILALESHRYQTVLVGENLGIVPGYVDLAMRRHGLAGMNVAYWEIASDPDGALQRMAANPAAVASLNTHDMFPFAAFWNALDADKRHELGMITAEQADLERWVRGELRNRLTSYLRANGHEITSEGDTGGALRGMLALLGQSQARWLLITLEDLWLETSPQNIPDTVVEHPNWRQKTRLTLEELIRDAGIESLMKIVDDARRSSRHSG
jgi:4-alpha-glucanotransferase